MDYFISWDEFPVINFVRLFETNDFRWFLVDPSVEISNLKILIDGMLRATGRYYSHTHCLPLISYASIVRGYFIGEATWQDTHIALQPTCKAIVEHFYAIHNEIENVLGHKVDLEGMSLLEWCALKENTVF